MKKIAVVLLLVTFFGFSCSKKTSEKAPEISMKNIVNYLASDSLKGREIGEPGEEMAASYIMEQMKSIGLKAAGTSTYFQTFEVSPSKNPHEKPNIGEGGDSLAIKGRNVIGKIDNVSDNVVVIGAHFDHLGMGSAGSLYKGEPAVHNGADDNASGVAVMLKAAEALSAMNLTKDYVFMAFSGEEKGLWGSNYYVKNPTLPLENISAMINLDMVGRLDEEKALAIHGNGTAMEWNDILQKQNSDSINLTLKESGVGPSDHTSFYLQDIPVLHFFTGQHEDYHKPSDDPEKLNYEGMQKITDLIVRICSEIDGLDSLSFQKTKDESSNTPRFKVTLGVVPDYLFDGKGMRIDGVSEGKPAQNAGIEKGDVVIKLGDIEVLDMMTYMKALSKFEAGEQTTVVIKRDKEEITFDITF